MSWNELSCQLMRAGQAACILEADAPKVGNVNRQHDYDDCLLEDFHLSAVLLGQVLAEVPQQSVGECILSGIKLTRQAVPTNTNLGILLLLAPLAKAWSVALRPENGKKETAPREKFRQAVEGVLGGLTIADSRQAYEGIRLAQPSGLGQLSEYDVTEVKEPGITLLQAMALSRERDLVALQYATGYRLLFEEIVPALESEFLQELTAMESIAQTGLVFLSRYHDSLIFRRHGLSLAEEVRQRAERAVELGGWHSRRGRRQTREFDAWLRGHSPRLNPGTTADLIAAALFVLLLEKGPVFWSGIRLKT